MNRNADLHSLLLIRRLAEWVDKDELKNIYPEFSQEIDAQFAIYDSAEYENSVRNGELLWYKRELQKVRVVECWYKRREKQTKFIMSNGEEVSESELTPELFFNGFIARTREVNLPVVRVCVFFDRIIFDMSSQKIFAEIFLQENIFVRRKIFQKIQGGFRDEKNFLSDFYFNIFFLADCSRRN